MSEPLQFDYHPDADQICAFVEHALSAHEREHMLDHLAVCTECRTVVALSLPHIEQPMQVPAVIQLKPWWLGWRLGLPAGALAAALTLSVFYIHRATVIQQTPAPVRIAAGRVTALSAPARQSSTPAASQPLTQVGNPSVIARHPAADVVIGVESVRKAETVTDSDQMNALRMQSRDSIVHNKFAQPTLAAPAASPGQIAALTTDSRGGTGASVVNGPSSTAGTLPQTTPAVPQQAKPVSSSVAPAESGPGTVTGRNTETLAVDSADRSIQTQSAAEFSSALSLKQEQVTQSILLKHPLPSGLPALSTAVQARRIVAIDGRNGIFFSTDAGKHWKAVHPQWQGRAVRVERAGFEPAGGSGLNLDRTLQQSAGKAVGAAPAPSAAPPRIAKVSPLAAVSGTSLAGTVTDATGAVVPGTSVSAIESATHTVRTVIADKAGHYFFDGLAPGTYIVEANAKGFAGLRVPDVAVASNHQNVVNLSLRIGMSTQAVTVSADSIQIVTDHATVKSSAKAKKRAEPAASPMAQPVFAIITDNGERWTSADGVTWERP